MIHLRPVSLTANVIFHLVIIGLIGLVARPAHAQDQGRPHSEVQADCDDLLVLTASFKPWDNVKPGAEFSVATLQNATRILSAPFAKLKETTPEIGLMVDRFSFEDFRQASGATPGTRAETFFLKSNRGVDYVELLNADDLKVIAQSDIFGDPTEAHCVRAGSSAGAISSSIRIPKNRGSVSAQELAACASEIQGQHQNVFDALREKTFLGMTLKRGQPIVIVHSHPLFAFKVIGLKDGQELPVFNEYFNLSPEDRIAAAAFSELNRDIPFIITALVPSGFKYSALFLNGKDITDQIEKYLR